MTIKSGITAFLLLLLLLTVKQSPASELVLHPNREEYLLGPQLSIFEDISKALTLRQIISGGYDSYFIPLKESSASFNNSRVDFWLKFDIDNRTNIRNWIIEISTSYVGHYDLYFSEAGTDNYQEVKGGSLLPFNQRYYSYESVLHRLPLKAGQKYNVLLKVRSATPVYFDPKLVTPRQFIEKATRLQYLLGLYYGIVLVLFIYSLFNFLAQKNRSYLWYGLYILFLGFMLLCIDGKILRYFLPDFPVLNQRLINIFLTTAAFFGLCYVKSFLQTRRSMPGFHTAISIFQVILFLSVAVTPFLPEFYSYAISQITPVPALLMMLTAGFISLKKGNKSARLFLLGFGSFALGAIITNLSYSMIIPNNDFTPYAIHCGSALEAIILIFGLSQQMSLLKNEKELAQQEIIHQLRENEQLATKVNRELEEKVSERTLKIRKQKQEIEIQKQEIEEKNKSITDSIYYARRIQEAMLPTDSALGKNFPGHFILYKPKDIVSGDFYWTGEKNGIKIIAAVDCTGHGVPGAFMSLIGNSLLNEIVNEKGITDPGEILNDMRTGVIRALKQTGQYGDSRDGMDVALCAISPSPKGRGRVKLLFAGANNPLWIVRKPHPVPSVSGVEIKLKKKQNSASGETEVETIPVTSSPTLFEEIKGDKAPVGIHAGSHNAFTTRETELYKGDTIYIFTDGYADQFGGPHGKKFKYKSLKELLITVNEKPMSEQKEVLNKTFEAWKGSLEQVDDICVIGVRI